MTADEFSGRLADRLQESILGYINPVVDVYSFRDSELTISGVCDRLVDTGNRIIDASEGIDQLLTGCFGHCPVEIRLTPEQKTTVRVPFLSVHNQTFQERVGAGMLECSRKNAMVRADMHVLSKKLAQLRANLGRLDGVIRLYLQEFGVEES